MTNFTTTDAWRNKVQSERSPAAAVPMFAAVTA
jgi:hypothetical protein